MLRDWLAKKVNEIREVYAQFPNWTKVSNELKIIIKKILQFEIDNYGPAPSGSILADALDAFDMSNK